MSLQNCRKPCSKSFGCSPSCVLDLAGAERGHQVGGAPLRLAQPEHEQRDEQAGEGDDHERRPPAERRADEPAEADAEAGAGEQHHLLDRERLAALVGRVVVADAGWRPTAR